MVHLTYVFMKFISTANRPKIKIKYKFLIGNSLVNLIPLVSPPLMFEICKLAHHENTFLIIYSGLAEGSSQPVVY